MVENALQIAIVLVSHRFPLISAVSSTGVNGRDLVGLLEELKQGGKKKRKIKTKTQNVVWIYCTDFPMSLFFLI